MHAQLACRRRPGSTCGSVLTSSRPEPREMLGGTLKRLLSLGSSRHQKLVNLQGHPQQVHESPTVYPRSQGGLPDAAQSSESRRDGKLSPNLALLEIATSGDVHQLLIRIAHYEKTLLAARDNYTSSPRTGTSSSSSWVSCARIILQRATSRDPLTPLQKSHRSSPKNPAHPDCILHNESCRRLRGTWRHIETRPPATHEGRRSCPH